MKKFEVGDRICISFYNPSEEYFGTIVKIEEREGYGFEYFVRPDEDCYYFEEYKNSQLIESFYSLDPMINITEYQET